MALVTDSLAVTLLTRIALIQRTIPGVQLASTRFYETINGPYAAFYNYVSRITPDYSNGAVDRFDTVEVAMRLIGGPAGAGAQSQVEDSLNTLFFTVLNTFDSRPYLSDTANVPLDYIAAEGATVGAASRISGYRVAERDNETLLGIEFTLRVPMLTHVPRLR